MLISVGCRTVFLLGFGLRANGSVFLPPRKVRYHRHWMPHAAECIVVGSFLALPVAWWECAEADQGGPLGLAAILGRRSESSGQDVRAQGSVSRRRCAA